MSEAKDLTEIRQQIQQRSAEQKLTQRSTMSVPEMRKLLGLKKTDSYWLVHKNLFKTQIIGGMMRIDLESFEKWYANQVKYKKVGGEEPGKGIVEINTTNTPPSERESIVKVDFAFCLDRFILASEAGVILRCNTELSFIFP